MNKVYKIIFDPILGLFKVVSELAKGKGKANKGKKLTTLVILTSLSSVAVATDYAAGGGQRRSSVAGSIVIGARDSGSDSAYAGKDGRDSAGNNGTVVGRTAIGWSTGDTAYGAFSNAKGSSVLNSNFGLADSFDSLYTRPSGDAFHLTTNSNKLSSNKGGDNVALGFKSSAFGLQSVSLGMKSIASGTNALSVGTHSVARDSYSVAIGSESKGMGEASVAVGTFSNALGNYQLDFTKFNDINNDGYSTITQPEQTYQTSNGSGSLKDNSSKYQLITSTLKTGTDGSTTMESKITAQNTSSNKEDAALGVKAIALGDRSASIGVKTVANGMAALALGTESVARKSYTIAQGYQAKAWEEGAIAIGQQAKANAQNAIVLGNGSSNQSQNALVLGNEITLASGNNSSVVIGHQSTIATNGETRGTSSYDSATIGGLTYGGFTGNPTSVFSIGPEGGRTLQHVAAGQISATSLDAINGSQLYRTNLALGNLATTLVSNLGGNAAVVNTNGNDLGNLSFTDIGTTGQSTVHDAIKTIAESTIKLDGDSGSTDQKNRKTNSSFGIKGAASGGITTTASGSDVQISLDQTTKDTLAKVAPMETKVTTIEGDLATTKSDLATTKNDLATTQGDVTNIQNTVNQLSSGKADTALSNLTDEGKNVITGLVDVTSSSSALNVSKSTDPNTKKKTFALSLDEAGIKQLAGTTNLAGDIEAAKTAAINEANSFTTNKINNLSSTLKFEGDTKTGEPQVNLKTETLKIKGKENFVTTSASGTELTIDLAESLKNKLNNLPTNATQDIQNITNKLGDTALTTVNGNTTPTTITQAINQITNAVNSGWEIQQGGNKKGDIGAGKKVNFANGNLTTASVEMPTDSDVATVKFDVQTTNLTNDSTGQVSAGDTAKLVTAGDIATAINTATSSLSSSLAFRGDNNKDVAATETGDTNTKVDLKTQTLKVLGTARQITTNATVDGLKIGLDSAITDKLTQLETSSTSAAGDITNIKNLLGNTNPTTAINGNNTAPTSISDAVNQLTTAVNTGWKLKGNGSVVGDIGATEAVDFVNGSNTTATVTAKTADKPATVSFSVNTATLANDSTTGTITTPTAADENKLVTAGNLATVVNQAVNPDKLAANVKLSYTSTNVSTTADAKKVSLSQGLNFKSPDDKLTITANDNGEVLFQAKDWTSDINTAKTEAIADAKTYTDTQISGLSSSLKFTGDTTATPEPSVDLKNQKLAVNGTSGYVTTKAEGQTLTIDLDSTLKGKLDNLPTNVNESLQTINNKIGTVPADAPNAQTSPAGADGLNGKSLTEQINALRDGTAGNVVYTDPAGNRLVKGADGNYYPKDTALGADGLPTDKTVQPVAKDQIVTTTVNPDGSTTTPTQMGNVKSGLGLDGTGADGTSGSPSDPKAITAEKAKEALNGKNGNPGLLAMEGANNLNKVATVGDLQALAQAGIDFLGNEAEGKAIHKTLGSTLKIEGKSNTTYDDNNKSTYSADNLITHNDNGTLRIEMLKTPTFEGVKLATNGGTPISLAPSEDGSSLTFSKPSDDGSSTMPVELKGIAAGTTDNSAINKAQLDELKNQLGLSDTPEVSPTDSPAGKDGLDGKTLTEKANALRDGLAGNVVYTDPNGNRLVKGSDGKYYPAEQVGNKVQGTDGKWYPEGTTFKDGNPIAKDGSPATALADTETPKEVAKDSIVSTAVNPDGSTANPIQMGNVKSGLGLDGTGKDGSGSPSDPKAITAEAAKNAIAGADGQSGLLTKSGADLNKVATVGDLQALAQAGLDFNGNNTDAVVHRPLGMKLEIVGDNPATDFTSAVGNINVFGDPTNNKLVIQLNKVLTNITSIGGGVKDSVTDKTSTNPEDQKAQLTFNDDDLALNNKTLSGVKSAIKPATETQDKTMLDHLKEAAKDKGSSVVNVEDLAGVTAALETELTDKGLSFGGDSGEKVSRKLGEQLDVKGGVTDPAKLTDNNIGVVTDPDNNALIVKLAKEISDISSITTETKDGQSATFNSAGMTITGSDDKAGQSASYGLGGTTLTNGENKAELKPESLTFSDATNPDGAKSSLSKDSLNFTKEDGSKGISVNGKDGTISNLADRTLVGKDGNGPLSSDYGTGDNRNNAATEGALKDLADKLGVSTPNTLPIDSTTGPSGADGLNGTSVLDKIQALRDGTAGNTVYTNEQGERLVKITTPDGSSAYYKAGDLTKDPTTGALTPNPNTTPVPSTNIVISNVNPDGSTTSPTQIANVKSGLGLDGSAGNNGVDGNPANPQVITAEAAKNAIAGADGNSGLLTQSGASLNKVATVGDLQALAQAGLDFVGNNEENVHRPLGTQLKVVGDGVDAAKAKDFESATGNINVKSNATDNSLTVQLAKDLKNLTSSEFKDADGNTTTVNGAGITITPPAKDDGSVAPSVSLSSKGLDNGGNKITNLAKGENNGDAVTIEQLKELTKAVTGSSNIDIANKEVNKDNRRLDDGTIFEGEFEGETSKDILVQDGKPVLKTYNVSDQKEYLTNSVYTAISNMNEQGIKFFHTNDGKTQQTNQASNTEDSSASGTYSTAVGYQSSAEGKNSLAMGSGSVVKGENSIVIGSEGSVHGSDSISVGTGNEVFGNNSGAFGDPSIINATSSYLVGNNSTLGSGDELTALVEERKALTRPTRPEKLEKKGKDESPQDYQNRVNAYLEKMAEYNTALADYMEKREAINEKITALSEKTQGVMAMGNNVTVTQGSHGALVMGSNSYVNVVNSGLDTNIQGIAIGNNTRVDTNASSVALGSGAHALQSLEALQAATVYAHEQAVGKGSEVIGEVSFGKEGEYRRLTNVAAGAADTDAVNVSQLKGVASNINQQLNNLSQNISGVAASSAAMANLPQAYLPGKSMVAVSTGYHKGQSAIALGVSRIADNGKLIIKASASHNTQNDFTGGIGVGYQW
ncbi:YadA-like family protein [Gallibacterium anatis]|uniref:YadA-like family protein n=1 Tax=Gallibacterium anatis TaxID=750 RepID=UPI0039FDC22F